MVTISTMWPDVILVHNKGRVTILIALELNASFFTLKSVLTFHGNRSWDRHRKGSNLKHYLKKPSDGSENKLVDIRREVWKRSWFKIGTITFKESGSRKGDAMWTKQKPVCNEKPSLCWLGEVEARSYTLHRSFKLQKPISTSIETVFPKSTFVPSSIINQLDYAMFHKVEEEEAESSRKLEY